MCTEKKHSACQAVHISTPVKKAHLYYMRSVSALIPGIALCMVKKKASKDVCAGMKGRKRKRKNWGWGYTRDSFSLLLLYLLTQRTKGENLHKWARKYEKGEYTRRHENRQGKM